MVCKGLPGQEERLLCVTCDTPWHVPCLFAPPPTLSATARWLCPDCSILDSDVPPVPAPARNQLVAAMLAVENDASLTQHDKARKRQELLTGKAPADDDDDDEQENKSSLSDILSRSLNCSICIQLPERPVTVRSFSSHYLICNANHFHSCGLPLPPFLITLFFFLSGNGKQCQVYNNSLTTYLARSLSHHSTFSFLY